MNVRDEKTGACAHRQRLRLGAVLALAAVHLSACADIRRATSLPPVNPESPVAGAVAQAAMTSFPRPSLAAVPPKPLNIAPPQVVKLAVVDMVRCRRAYEMWIAAHPAGVSGSSAFAERLQAQLDNDPKDRPTPQDEAAVLAEAEKLRAYAKPPPALAAGPPLTAADAAAPVAGAPTTLHRAAHVTAPVKIAAAAPKTHAPSDVSGPVAAAAPQRATPPAAPTAMPVATSPAAVEPSMAPPYADPVLAHCR